MIEEKHILSYIEGTASDSEKLLVERWIASSESNQRQFESLKLMWAPSKSDSAYVQFDTVKEWDDFANMLGISIEESAFKHVQSSHEIEKVISKKSPLNVSWQSIGSVAASIATLIFATWFLWPQPKFLEIVNATENQEIELEDGTKALLSRGASMKTLRSYKYETSREVTINGEVNFDVASNASKPFVVLTHNAGVIVLGTKFNVKTENEASEVANEEGQVRFYNKENENQYVDLNPGDVIRFDGKDFEDLNEPPLPPPTPPPAPEIRLNDVLSYLKRIGGQRITFGSGLDMRTNPKVDIEFEGKSVREVIRLLNEVGTVTLTTSCTGCYRIEEIRIR